MPPRRDWPGAQPPGPPPERGRAVMSGPGRRGGADARAAGVFEQLIGWLESEDAVALEHAELEELLRQMLQGSLDLRALPEQHAAQVREADGTRHGAVEAGHTRGLRSIFGSAPSRSVAIWETPPAREPFCASSGSDIRARYPLLLILRRRLTALST
jgi:hypothetical protein